jgi:hypothetical protein
MAIFLQPMTKFLSLPYQVFIGVLEVCSSDCNVIDEAKSIRDCFFVAFEPLTAGG